MGSRIRSAGGKRPARLSSLPAAGSARPRALILGSLPGAASLAAGQYYAHPRNQFWPIMAELFGFSASLSYQQKLAQLEKRRIAVWDVLASARRTGSADAAIETATMRFNNMAGLIDKRGSIEVVALNGGLARRSFAGYLNANRTAACLFSETRILPMPSTSPAYASKSLAAKLAIWRQLAEALQEI